ncbi:helix-turn-helix domain-containing protein, partial [Nocardia brasiliensis]|uniref:helix-turn-helix domain-containing protein n=1 Tax=Nocardia brasiliensis TaxID=37326 RepID=UPI003CC7E2E3
MMTAAVVKKQISELGGAFMLSREVKEFGSAIGVSGFHGPYTRGRGGVLGEVDADVVAAGFGFFAPERVRSAWESTPIAAAEAAQAYSAACQDFGRRKLASFEAADRLAELLERVAAAAGWPRGFVWWGEGGRAKRPAAGRRAAPMLPPEGGR